MSPTSRLVLGTLLAVCGVFVASSAFPQTSGTSPVTQATAATPLLPAVPAARSLYLDAVPAQSSATVSPGASFSVWLDVVPKPGMRVYAPGNRDYRPVSLSIDALPGVRVGPVQFPKAETFVFAPLKERVQVFSQPFRLTRTVTIDATAKPAAALDGAALALRGRLEYQACDDKVCYLPQTLPVTWSISIKH